MNFDFNRMSHQEIAGWTFQFATNFSTFNNNSRQKMIECALRCIEGEQPYNYATFFSESGDFKTLTGEQIGYYANLTTNFTTGLVKHLNFDPNSPINPFIKPEKSLFQQTFFISSIKDVGEVLDRIGDELEDFFESYEIEYRDSGVEFEADFDLSVDELDNGDDAEYEGKIVTLDDNWIDLINEIDFSSLDEDSQ